MQLELHKNVSEKLRQERSYVQHE